MKHNGSNTRVKSFKALYTPAELRTKLPCPADFATQINRYRQEIANLIAGKDQRLLVVVGPCSIHDTTACLEYAEKLKALATEVADRIYIVMRVYFEKPRTTVGWKGLINDPQLDGSCDMEAGISKARQFLLAVTALGLPTATEFLDPIVPQYIADLVSWAAIGARTTESQTHREMASGLSMPVGFKNATDGSLDIAVNALVSATHSHSFLGIDDDGKTAIVTTNGNHNGHIILRGGGGQTNYSQQNIKAALKLLGSQASPRPIMIDCSHGNSNKDFSRQPQVWAEVGKIRQQGESSILGMMLESHLVSGRQDLGNMPLTYGQSITDGCLDFATTAALLRQY